MKTLYRAGSTTEAHIVAGMLEAHGIQSYVGGHHLQGGVGEIATLDFARVWVTEADYAAALPLIAAYEQHEPEDVSHAEQVTKPAKRMGLFTPPVLFWVTIGVLLGLLLWFIF